MMQTGAVSVLTVISRGGTGIARRLAGIAGLIRWGIEWLLPVVSPYPRPAAAAFRACQAM
jgi:hypothetical protein